ncbi:NYN domain-containing protein [Mrakia frigida]|uniref:NYN domain-containing protein n=1 Tax=Mrakia frigida TaxID=29902 RepID=UPI003FCC062E
MFLKRSFTRRSAQPASPSPSSSSPSSPPPIFSSKSPSHLNHVRGKSQAHLSTPASKRVSIATELLSSTSFDGLASSSSSPLDTVQTSSSTVKVATAPKHDSVTLSVLRKELGIEQVDQRRYLRSHSSKTPITSERINAITEHEMLVQISHKRDEMIYTRTLPRTFPETNSVHDVYHPSNASSSGKSREQLLEDQLASERRERTLERELERARRGGGEASPGGGGGASGRVANGANGATKGSVLVVWDFESCRPPPGTNGPALVKELRRFERFGVIRSIQMYEDPGGQLPSGEKLRSTLLSCGVKIQGRGTAKRKEGADYRLICDTFGFALDNEPPATVVLLSSDTEYSDMLSSLRSRGYNIILVESAMASDELRMSAAEVYKFHDIVRAAGVAAPTQDPSQQSTERPIARAQPTLPPQPFAAAVARPPPSRPQPASAAPPTSTTPILPPSAPIRTTPIPPSSAPPMADFSPLIAALKSRPSQPPPLRSLVGELVLRINLKAFSMAGTTTCREYFDAARASGVVTMGNGAKAGAEWIGLVASNSSSDPQPSQPQSVVPSAQHKFQPLIDVLKSSPYPFPLRAKVAADLFQLKLVPSFFSRAGVDNWKDYVNLAVKEGVVNIGVGTRLGSEWIALPKSNASSLPSRNPARSSTPSSAPSTTAKLMLHSPQARLLVEVLLQLPADPPPHRSRVNDLMLVEQPDFVKSAGFETWADFAVSASKLGLVTLGITATAPWISLTRHNPLVLEISRSPRRPLITTPSSVPSTTRRTYAPLDDRHLAAASMLRPLVAAILARPAYPPPLRSLIMSDVLRKDPRVFESVQVSNWQEYAALAVSLNLVELGKTASSPWIRLVADRAQLRRALATNNFDASPNPTPSSSSPLPPPPPSDDPFTSVFPFGIDAPARPSSPGSDTSEVQLLDLPPTSSSHDAIFEQVGFDFGTASSGAAPEEADGWQKVVGGKGKK